MEREAVALCRLALVVTIVQVGEVKSEEEIRILEFDQGLRQHLRIHKLSLCCGRLSLSTPTTARRDEGSTRHRRRSKVTGVVAVEYMNTTRPSSKSLINIQKDHCGQDKWQSGIAVNRFVRLLLRNQGGNKSPGKLKYVRQPSSHQGNRNKCVRCL